MSRVSDLSCSVVGLPCYRVAMARSFGESPEFGAWSTLLEWAERSGLDPVLGEHRFFGFNDPSPAQVGEPYGYQQWMTVTTDVTADPHEEVSILEFGGGVFATTRNVRLDSIGDRWRRLYDYAIETGLELRHEPGMEELLTSPAAPPADFVFDLYLAVEPRAG